MTDKEWDRYFKTLTRKRKEELYHALVTLNNDLAFKKAYGSDFADLVAIIDMQFSPSNVNRNSLYNSVYGN